MYAEPATIIYPKTKERPQCSLDFKKNGTTSFILQLHQVSFNLNKFFPLITLVIVAIQHPLSRSKTDADPKNVHSIQFISFDGKL